MAKHKRELTKHEIIIQYTKIVLMIIGLALVAIYITK